jgi:hypothetical protein
MTDERLFERLAAHAGPADVDPGFEDRLYAVLQAEMGRPDRSSRPVLLLAAALAAILAISTAVAVGSGVIELPWLDESPIPSPSAAASASAEPSPSAEQVRDPSWTTAADMIEARDNHTATQLLDGRVLVAGGVGPDIGEGGANILASAEIYDPSSGQWTTTGAMVEIRAFPTAVLLSDGRVLVLGGSGCSDFDGCPSFSAELYDPTTGTWAATQSTTAGGGGRTATLLDDGTVLVVGGSIGSLSEGDLEPIGVAERYDPSTGQWSATGPLVQVPTNHTATELVDGRVLVVGDTATPELYDPSTGQWTATAPMAGIRMGHSATLLPDGTVLVTGGMAGTGASDLAELYDSSTDQWIATGDMLEARLFHTATPLADGRVVVMGGVNSVIDGGVALTSAELYDPSSGSWTATLRMSEARRGHVAVLLPDGTVLVAGGLGDTGLVSTAELFDPGSGN